jgi:hypothetical protein
MLYFNKTLWKLDRMYGGDIEFWIYCLAASLLLDVYLHKIEDSLDLKLKEDDIEAKIIEKLPYDKVSA